MAHHVRGGPGHYGVTLPGGWVLDPGDDVIISDDEWNIIVASGVANYLEDLGPSTLAPARAPSYRDIQRAALNGGTGTQGPPGADGRSIVSVVLTSGDHSPGTLDTYTINYSYGAPSTYQVYNGANGAAGATGPPGPAGTNYFATFNFATASTTWLINHAQGTYGVVVETFDDAGNPIEGLVSYPDINHVQVDWYFPMTGSANVFN